VTQDRHFLLVMAGFQKDGHDEFDYVGVFSRIVSFFSGLEFDGEPIQSLGVKARNAHS